MTDVHELSCLGSGLSEEEQAAKSAHATLGTTATLVHEELYREAVAEILAKQTISYPAMSFVPANPANYTAANRPRDYSIDTVVEHVMQGTQGSAVSWFRNPAAQVTAHYCGSKTGPFIQTLGEANIAWHAGNWNYNTRSIGIEHEGTFDNPGNWTDHMIQTSAQLTAAICQRYGISPSRVHIIGHGEVPNSPHPYCPGKYFPYDRYVSLVKGESPSKPAPVAPKPAGAVKWINAAFSVRDTESNNYAVAFAHGLQAVNAPAGITPRMTKAAKDATGDGIYTVLFGDDAVATLKNEAPAISIVPKGAVMSADGTATNMHNEARYRIDYLCKLGGYDSGAALKSFEDALGKFLAG